MFEGGLKTALGEGLILDMIYKGDGSGNAQDGDEVEIHFSVKEQGSGQVLFTTTDSEPKVMKVGTGFLVEDHGFDRVLKKLSPGGRAVLHVPVDMLKPLDKGAEPVDSKIEIVLLRINDREYDAAAAPSATKTKKEKSAAATTYAT